MKKCIITTTISKPTEALIKFSQMEGWDLIVVGDLKTPHGFYRQIDCTYLTPEFQETNYKELSYLIGWNCIQRRNLGFVYAHNKGYDLIATVDDDNDPYTEKWGKNLLFDTGKVLTEVLSDDIVVDPINTTNYFQYWHRGFPIQLVADRLYRYMGSKETFDIQANFWDGDPDIDAICRMIYKPSCTFHVQPFFTRKFSPFNSQNTILKREVIPHYFMFPFVGRMDDIWASYYVEALGYKVVYGESTVRQDRNEHDLTNDFIKEEVGYEHTLELLHSLKENPENIKNFIPERSWLAFQEYQRITLD